MAAPTSTPPPEIKTDPPNLPDQQQGDDDDHQHDQPEEQPTSPPQPQPPPPRPHPSRPPHPPTDHEDPLQYWGYLFKPDKTPTERLDRLLKGVANHINAHVEPLHPPLLTPVKLAAFYRLVGGNYDSLFLETPPPSLSFIYQSLGCCHSLQPTHDDFAPPSIPTLEPRGFVRWQTIQLLLGPEEHVPFLQDAVRRFDIKDPSTGETFPKILPKEAFPERPDEDVVGWHDQVTDRLRKEAQRAMMRSRQRGRDPQQSFADTRDSNSRDGKVSDAADYFSNPHYRDADGRPHIVRISHSAGSHHRYERREDPRGGRPRFHYRRSSLPEHYHPQQEKMPPPQPSGYHHEYDPKMPPHQHGSRSRHHRSPSPSSLSTSSTSATSDTDEHVRAPPHGRAHEGSVSPIARDRRSQEMSPKSAHSAFPSLPQDDYHDHSGHHYHHHHHHRPYDDDPGQRHPRRHSDLRYGPPPPNAYPPGFAVPPAARVQHVAPPPPGYFARPSTSQPGYYMSEESGVRRPSIGGIIGARRVSSRSVERERERDREYERVERVERGRERDGDRWGGRRLASPVRGVDGRRYPADQRLWR
ncbi:MAG: hypothetical protein M1819_005508 [Sarea resinae]|nr:MAG: hypothetical protein M1819_005508 [Sarea resinae]